MAIVSRCAPPSTSTRQRRNTKVTFWYRTDISADLTNVDRLDSAGSGDHQERCGCNCQWCESALAGRRDPMEPARGRMTSIRRPSFPGSGAPPPPLSTFERRHRQPHPTSRNGPTPPVGSGTCSARAGRTTRGPRTRLPNAVLIANPQSGTAPLTVNFSASTSTDPDGDVLDLRLGPRWGRLGPRRRWAEGRLDQSPLRRSPTRLQGTYQVSVAVSDGRGGSDTDAVTIVVNAPTGPGGIRFNGGAGAVVTTPDRALLDLAGDLDIRADVALDDWNDDGARLVSKGNAYELSLNGTTGGLRFAWTRRNGSASAVSSTVPLPVADGTRVQVRVTFDASHSPAEAERGHLLVPHGNLRRALLEQRLDAARVGGHVQPNRSACGQRHSPGSRGDPRWHHRQLGRRVPRCPGPLRDRRYRRRLTRLPRPRPVDQHPTRLLPLDRPQRQRLDHHRPGWGYVAG